MSILIFAVFFQSSNIFNPQKMTKGKTTKWRKKKQVLSKVLESAVQFF